MNLRSTDYQPCTKPTVLCRMHSNSVYLRFILCKILQIYQLLTGACFSWLYHWLFCFTVTKLFRGYTITCGIHHGYINLWVWITHKFSTNNHTTPTSWMEWCPSSRMCFGVKDLLVVMWCKVYVIPAVLV